MEIRAFREGDEPALLRVFVSSVHRLARNDYTAEQLHAWAPLDADPDAWAERMRALRPYVVETDDEIVAYADLQPDGLIDHFYVAGAYAGGGVGRELMMHLHEQAKALALPRLTAHVSRTAEPFFAHFGFAVIERRTPLVRGVAVPNVVMRKKLR
ncbi:GNAT family N-acetyltransferase [Paraburkholderia phosphatilytica]|uniref:GNAT family N-acetyltransferase n=1 Tax=Paraburkholderia phosphatilytica TaxID=2282883 RepID=UPI000E5275A3|nr:GNAT family N-acetyltransferase [Paraburkholderia phosphatilytica]